MSDTLQAVIDKANVNVGAAQAMAAAPALAVVTVPVVQPTLEDTLKVHDKEFVAGDIWKEYTPEELYWWTHLLLKRAGMRVKGEKFDKDVYDAGNYLGMYKSALADYDPKVDPEIHPNVITLTAQLRSYKGA